MGRIKVTASHKKKKNRPVTRIGSKQYKKRRWAHVRKVQVAGHDNELTREVMMTKGLEGGGDSRKGTPFQHYTRVGITLDPSMSAYEKQQRKDSVKVAHIKRGKLPEPAEDIKPARMVTETEGTILANLMHKHGTNFKAMSLDYKLNPFQLTPAQLQRKLANYLKFERAAFPKEYAEMEELGIILDDPKMMERRRRQRPEDDDVEESEQ